MQSKCSHAPFGMKVRLLAAVSLATVGVLGAESSAVVFPDTLQPGDIIFTDNSSTAFTQLRNGTRVGQVDLGGSNERIGGLFTDSAGNLFIAQQPAGANIAAPDRRVERMPIGSNTSVVIIPTEQVPNGRTLRSGVIGPSGNIYVLYSRDIVTDVNDPTGQGNVEKFTPSGPGYTGTLVGNFTDTASGAAWTGNDRGSGHQLALTASESYLLAGTRQGSRVFSMNTSTGAVQSWTTPATGFNGPVTGARLVLSPELDLDPLRQNRIIAGMGTDGLYEIDFDPTTGGFPTAEPRRLNNDAGTEALFIDALKFDQNGNLFVSTRDDATNGSIRMFTQAELVAAAAGTPFSIFNKTPIYTGTDARIARDIAIIVPEPGTAALVGLASLGLLARRRRNRL